MPQIKNLTAALLICFAGLSASTTSLNALAETNASVIPTITTANAEFVYKYLLGEIAGQRGDVVLASQLFLEFGRPDCDRAAFASTIRRP